MNPSPEPMKNAIVFSVDATRWAVELRWVREVITLGHVTPVPRAPAAIAGVVNFAGGIVPIIELGPLLGKDAPARLASRGESALLLHVESVRAAIRLDAVVEVATLRRGDDGGWRDSGGERVELVDPSELVTLARNQVTGAGARSEA